MKPALEMSNDEVVTTSTETICDYKAYCSICCKIISHNGFDQIGGEGLEVEINKFKFGKRKYNSGQDTGFLEVSAGEFFVTTVDKRDKNIKAHNFGKNFTRHYYLW